MSDKDILIKYLNNKQNYMESQKETTHNNAPKRYNKRKSSTTISPTATVATK